MANQNYTLKDFLLDEYFRRWVMGPADPEVTAFWEQWLENNPGKAQEIGEAREILQMIRFRESRPGHPDEAEIWEQIEEVIREDERIETERKVISMRAPAGKHTGKRRIRVRYAAVLAGLLAIASLFFYLFYSAPVRHDTAYGEVKTVVLPDNSVVKLNANSSLRYSRNWKARKPREIWLNGEAFFSVVHKSNEQQFLVHTDDMTVQVTGTEFNVNTRHITTKVVLNNGSVRLHLSAAEAGKPGEGTPSGLFMQPGDMVSWSSRTGKLVTRKVDPELYSSWRTNILTFRDTPIAEVVRSLQDNFGLSIHLEGEDIRNETFTGAIPMDHVDIFFETLTESLDVEIIKKNGEIYIAKKGV